MKKIYAGENSILTGSGERAALTYYLLVDELSCGGAFALESYGVGVEKRAAGTVTYASCSNVTCSQTKIERLIGALVRGAVTPIALSDVVEDWE